MSNGATLAEIEALYRARSRVFLYSIAALLEDGEAALDVVQEGFALALRRRESFRGAASLETWLWRIVLNVAHERRRSMRRQESIDDLDLSNAVPAEPVDDLRTSLLSLPERQRLAVFLRYYADLSYGQIAEALGVRPGTVAASLHAAHAALRRRMEGVAG